jgi:D-beta-D-heptose 7-phosphate kinase/D-beta-D-heptose 1-phosphate adenosyltransferase
VASKAVLVIGDVMLDRCKEGTMTRISPEAPSPVVKVESLSSSLGGAGNVAANLAALGRKVYLLGDKGSSATWDAKILTDLCDQAGITHNLRSSTNPTVVKERVTVGGTQVLRLDTEEVNTLDDGTDYYVSAVESLLTEHTGVGAIVYADYCKGVVRGKLVTTVTRLATKLNIPIYLDTKPAHASTYPKVDVFKPNLKEALEMLGPAEALHLATDIKHNGAGNVALHCARKLKQYGAEGIVIVTAGAAGAACAYGNGEDESFLSSVTPQECFDPTGCGDTFMAAFVDSQMRDYDLPSAVLRANTAGAKAASMHGTTVLTRNELEDAVLARLGDSGKCMTMRRTLEYLERKRADGKNIVFTNGTFRYLHHGHMATMRYAKAQGDILVVGINSDASIEQLKPGQTYVPEAERAAMLSHFPFVDVIVIFDDPDVTDTIKAIKPLFLVKGAEYREKHVPGADFVAKYGGEVRFAPMIDGFHASDLT